MSNSTHLEMAAKVVELFKWRNSLGLGLDKVYTPEELDLVRELLKMAGFKFKDVETGWCTPCSYSNGEQRINPFSRIRVVGENGLQNDQIIVWIDDLVRLNLPVRADQASALPKVISSIAARIEETFPLEPIPLFPNREGYIEAFMPMQKNIGNSQYQLQRQPRDTDLIADFTFCGQIGMHQTCGGAIKRVRISTEFDALLCTTCYMRNPIPCSIENFEQLRYYPASKSEPGRHLVG